MGQGQEVHARRLLQQFMLEGGWVLLQNCHLGLNFMDELLDTVALAYSSLHTALFLQILVAQSLNFCFTGSKNAKRLI